MGPHTICIVVAKPKATYQKRKYCRVRGGFGTKYDKSVYIYIDQKEEECTRGFDHVGILLG